VTDIRPDMMWARVLSAVANVHSLSSIEVSLERVPLLDLPVFSKKQATGRRL
jgi:hypothetical protein